MRAADAINRLSEAITRAFPMQRPLEPITSRMQRATTASNADNCWSVGVMNLTEREARDVMNYASVLQRDRSMSDKEKRDREIALGVKPVDEGERRDMGEDVDLALLKKEQVKALRRIDPNGELPRGVRLEFGPAANCYFLIDSLGFSAKIGRNSDGRLCHVDDRAEPTAAPEPGNRFSGLDIG